MKRELLLQLNAFDYAKCSFDLQDSSHYEGWIIEILEEKFEFVSAGPLAAAASIFIKIADLDEESLSYYDEKRREWIDFGGYF